MRPFLYILYSASLRAQYGTEMPFNAVHGSWDLEDARRELALLFPSFQFTDQIPESAPLGKSSRQIWSCVCVCVCARTRRDLVVCVCVCVCVCADG